MLLRPVITYLMEERTFFTKRNRKLDAISKSWVFRFFKIQVGLVWESIRVEECPLSFYTPLLEPRTQNSELRPFLRPFLTARVQDLGFRKITLWGGKNVNFSRTQKLRTRVLEKQGHFSRTLVILGKISATSNSHLLVPTLVKTSNTRVLLLSTSAESKFLLSYAPRT